MPRRSISSSNLGAPSKSGVGILSETAVPVGFRHNAVSLFSALVAPDCQSLLDGGYVVVGQPDQLSTKASKAAMHQEQARPLPGVVTQKSLPCTQFTLFVGCLAELAPQLGLQIPSFPNEPGSLTLDGSERVTLEVREVSKVYHSRPRSVLRHFWPSDATLSSHSQRGFFGMAATKLKLYVVTSLWHAANVTLNIETRGAGSAPSRSMGSRARRMSAPAAMHGGCTAQDAVAPPLLCGDSALSLPPELCCTLQTLLEELAANGGSRQGGSHVLYVPLAQPLPVAAEVMKLTWTSKSSATRVEAVSLPQAPPKRRQWEDMTDAELWDSPDVGID